MKKICYKYCLLVITGLSVYNGYSQMCFDTIRLAEIKIEAGKTAQIASKVLKIDSTTLKNSRNADVGMVLQSSGNVMLRSNGPGLLSTISFRGASSSHSTVTWNGLQLNSPMLGQTDFSQVPAGFADEITISQNTNIFGQSTRSAGFINLETYPKWNSTFYTEAILRAASYNTFSSYLNAGKSWKKISLSTRFFLTGSENNYLYHIYSSDSMQRRRNSNFNNYGLMNDFYYKTGKNSQFSIKTWIQTSHTKIPSEQNRESQNYNTFKLIADYNIESPRYSFKTSAGYNSDELKYVNPLLMIHSKSKAATLSQQSLLKINIEYVKAELSYKIFHHMVNADAYEKLIVKDEAEINQAIYYQSGGLLINISNNQIISGKNTTFLNPSAGFMLEPSAIKRIRLKASARKFIHFPTLNDLYWNDSLAFGNPGLQPETGWLSETGVTLWLESEKHFISIEIAPFYAETKNWILWHPENGRWTPDNLKFVIRKGIELAYKAYYKTGSINLAIQGNCNFVKATNKTKLFANDLSANKQLIYVPAIQTNHQIRFGLKNSMVAFTIFGNSKSFTTSDNSRFIDGYCISAVNVYYDIPFQHRGVMTISAGCHNIFNTSYMIMQGFPMPGRTFEISVKYQYEKR